MIVRVSWPKERLARAVRGVKKLASYSFVDSLPLSTYREWVTNKLQKESPKSGQGKTGWIRWIRAGGESESAYAEIQRPKFWKGWTVEVGSNRQGLKFDIDHALLELGRLGKERFESTLTGHGAFTWASPRDYRVKLAYWRRFVKGQTTRVDAAEGTPVIENTEKYLHGWFEQRLARDIQKAVDL